MTFLGNGSNSSFSFPFIGVSASDITVIYTNASGVATTLAPSQYSLFIAPTPFGELWSVGGQVTYPISGSPIATGTSLTIQRTIPLQQLVSISGQGDFNPQVVEQALDLLEMQIQQISGRSGQFRGTWVAGANYNYGDLIQDGANGLNSGNYYFCAISNTSVSWSTDLAAGDWVLAIQAVIPTATLPLSIANGGTGSTTAAAALAALGGIALNGTNAFTGANSFTAGSIAVPTASPGDSTTKAASTAFVATNFAPKINPTFTGTVTATTFSGSGAGLNSIAGKQLVGTNTNDNAAAGNVGEYITASAGGTVLTTATAANVASISLTAGDWDVWGTAIFGGSSTDITYVGANISQTINSVDGLQYSFPVSFALAGVHMSGAVPTQRVSLASTTTFYLNEQTNFGTGTVAGSGSLSARRRR